VEGYKWLTVFITCFSPFKMLVTLFSLYNVPAIFQNYINHVLYNILDNYCTVYFDNILIFFRTQAEHTKYINKIIYCFRAAGLQINISKSEFYIKKIKYLGLIISTNSISIDSEKVQALQA